MSQKQSFQNHMRWFPIYHYFASPVTAIYAVYAITQAVKAPSQATILHALWAAAISAAVVASRLMAIIVQNRLIRLEMRLRMKEVLSAELATRAKALTVRQLIALRFAGDAELPGLVERTLKGEFANGKDIKVAITDWQADWLRA